MNQNVSLLLTNIIDKTKSVQGSGLEKELNCIEETVDEESIKISKDIIKTDPLLPQVIFDPNFYKYISEFGVNSQGKSLVLTGLLIKLSRTAKPKGLFLWRKEQSIGVLYRSG